MKEMNEKIWPIRISGLKTSDDKLAAGVTESKVREGLREQTRVAKKKLNDWWVSWLVSQS